jgi:serine/threonine protein kinase
MNQPTPHTPADPAPERPQRLKDGGAADHAAPADGGGPHSATVRRAALDGTQDASADRGAGTPDKKPEQRPPSAGELTLPARFGDYELLEEVARGGMGVVYKARQTGLNRTVALKVIRDEHLGAEESVQRFHREAQAAAALDHPHIVAIHDIGSHDGRHYFTMSFVEGPNLKEVVRERGLPSPAEVVGVMLAVTEAVAFAHQHGIIHRDLKPENVLIDRQGRPRVTDFGLAKHVEKDHNLTQSGQVLGTPAYMSPEQAMGETVHAGPAADVYSLGALLFFLLTGRPPFQGRSLASVLAQAVLDEPPKPRELNPKAPAELEVVALKCLEKDPSRRYASADELAAELRALAPRFGATALRPPGGSSDTVPSVASAENGSSYDTLRRERGPSGGLAAGTGGGRGPRSTVRKPGPVAPKKKRRLIVWAAFALVVLLVVGLGGWRIWGVRAPQGETKNPEDPWEHLLPPEGQERKDFGLRAEFIGGRDENGVRILVDGQRVHFRVWAERDCYVSIWTLEADGTALQLYPNRRDTNNRFKAGETRIVPETAVADALQSPGLDRIWVEASTKPLPQVTGNAPAGLPFLLFKRGREQEAWAEQRRTARKVRVDDDPRASPDDRPALAEVVLKNRVVAAE